MDTSGLLAPHREFLGIKREGVLKTLDDRLVLEEEDGSVRGLKAVEALLRGGVRLGGDDSLDGGLRKVYEGEKRGSVSATSSRTAEGKAAGRTPDLVVVSSEGDDDPGRLGVKGRGSVLDDGVDELDAVEQRESRKSASCEGTQRGQYAERGGAGETGRKAEEKEKELTSSRC